MLDDTLVVWGGEFGRTPFNEKGNGRDHNPWGFTMWMAGGGVKGGQTIGTTDEIGLRAVEQPCPRARHPRVDPVAAGPRSSSVDVHAQRPGRTADDCRG